MSSVLCMRSVPDDRTARAVIWDEALRLFADRGPDGVSVRQIAAADAVSPGLVVHRFGSKEGLRQEVDEHGLGLFDRMLGVVTGEDAAGLYDPAAPGPVAEVIVKLLPAGSPVPGYLRRLLLADGDTGRELFRRLFRLSAPTLDAQAAAGMAAPGSDPAVRAAFLLASDLAVLLRDHLTEVLGTDPLSAPGMTRWASEVLTIYAAEMLAAPPP